MKIGKHLIANIRFGKTTVIFESVDGATCTFTPPSKAIKVIADDEKQYFHIFGSGIINAYVHHQIHNSISDFSTESTVSVE